MEKYQRTIEPAKKRVGRRQELMVARCLLRALLSFSVLLRLVAAVNGDGAFFSGDFSSSRVPPDLYHSSYGLLKEVKDLVGRHPDLFMLEIMRAENKGYIAEMVAVTYNYVNNNKNDKLKFRVLLSFGQHGRELITTEVALHLLSVLSDESKILGMKSKPAKEMMNNLIIKVVPMENLNGRRLVEAGDFCERRNGRGVDLNRNWSVDWGKKEKDYDPYEENPGIAPFSEPEAQIMRNLSLSFDPHIWINVHSGMEALFMPYDHKNSTPDGQRANLMTLLLKELNHRHFEDKCSVGSGGGLVGYLAHGTTTDYMFDVAKVPMAFTFEIYGDPTASSKDCFKMFNPTDKIEFKKVINKWTTVFLALFKMAPRWLNSDHFQISSDVEKWIPIGNKVSDGNLAGTITQRNMEGLDLGLQELRTYFRLFMFSSVLLIFMFCSRILKSKYREMS